MSKMRYYRHKGYLGSAEVDCEANCLHGKILFIQDLVTYEAETPEGLEREFIDAVEDYLATCEELGRTPDRTFKGSFNVRVGEDLHREVAIASAKCGKNLNEFVKSALEKALEHSELVVEHKHEHEHKVTHVVEHVQFNQPQGSTQWNQNPQSSKGYLSNRSRSLGSNSTR